MTKHLEIHKISKNFTRDNGETVRGLNQLSLSVAKGEVIGILGTNGAGKSTFFNALTGQNPVDEGEIILNGQRIDRQTPVESSQSISRVFQDPTMGTAPRMSVFENLMLALKRGEKRGLTFSLTDHYREEMAQRLAHFKLDLENRLDVPMEYLSGGQRQAVALVMATIKKPQLLLLDEHTAALDPRTGEDVMAMTQKIVQEEGITTLMITHHLQDAIDYCDRIIVMHQGSIRTVYDQTQIQSLTPSEIFQEMEDLVAVPYEKLEKL